MSMNLMRTILIAMAACLLVGSSAISQREVYPNERLLMEPAGLAERLADADVLTIDMRSPAVYESGHIPGAVNLPVGELVAEVAGVPFEFEAGKVEAALRRIGLEKDQIVVIYDDLGMMDAARLFWTLEYAGHEDARVLHGGWNAWVAAGLPVEEGPVTTAPTRYVLDPRASRLMDARELLARLGDADLVIADARSYPEYTGELALADRGGRIPGAVHLPWFEALTGGDTVPTTQEGWREELRDPDVERFAAPRELEAWLGEKGLSRDAEIITYCQTLWRGAHLYFVLRLMGYEDVRGYDGSWAEWGNRPEYPVERGEAAPPR